MSNNNNISIGALYKATHPLLIWDHPYGRNRVINEMPPEHIFLPIEKAEMFRSWFKILYNEKTGWINIQNADYKAINENRQTL